MVQLFKTILICSFCLFLPFSIQAKSATPQLSATYAILVDAETGGVLYEKKGFEKCFPASTTKLATALFVLKEGYPMEKRLVANKKLLGTLSEQKRLKSFHIYGLHVLEYNGTHMSLKPDEVLSLEELLYGLMLASANDAANVIAEGLCGDVSEFMRQMNVMLEEIGCENTQLLNPHGLFHEEHSTTAYDMALVMREGLKIPSFRKLINKAYFSVPATNKSGPRELATHNRLIKPGKHHYAKSIGGKTGTLKNSGICLVSAAEDNGRKLIAVVFDAKDPPTCYRETKNLFEFGFRQKIVKNHVLKAGYQPFTKDIPGSEDKLQTWTKKPITIEVFASEKLELKRQVIWEKCSLPIQKGQKVGRINILGPQKTLLASEPLFAVKEVRATFPHAALSKTTEAGQILSAHTNWLGWACMTFLGGSFFLKRYKKSR